RPGVYSGDEGDDPLVVAETLFVAVERRREIAARLEEQRIERIWVPAMRVQHRQRAEASAHADPRAGRDQVGQGWDHFAPQRPCVARVGRIPAVPGARSEQGGAEPG